MKNRGAVIASESLSLGLPLGADRSGKDWTSSARHRRRWRETSLVSALFEIVKKEDEK